MHCCINVILYMTRVSQCTNEGAVYLEQSLNGAFLLCDAMRCTVLVIVILSVRLFVCLSVRLSHSWTVSAWLYLRS